ncbi:MAG: hypothetical protein PHQ14_05685 [Chromatiales bacterium]|jgi:hypothetical protein|nr:hypothetical protein [Chromatiales bacterium]MDX9765949.1 hypothetical protein [Ectothiorhodospiraceae bacterium]
MTSTTTALRALLTAWFAAAPSEWCAAPAHPLMRTAPRVWSRHSAWIVERERQRR